MRPPEGGGRRQAGGAAALCPPKTPETSGSKMSPSPQAPEAFAQPAAVVVSEAGPHCVCTVPCGVLPVQRGHRRGALAKLPRASQQCPASLGSEGCAMRCISQLRAVTKHQLWWRELRDGR